MEIENFIELQKTQIQYAPLDVHCSNATEWSIKILKNHFKAGLASLPHTFPCQNSVA